MVGRTVYQDIAIAMFSEMACTIIYHSIYNTIHFFVDFDPSIKLHVFTC